MSVKRSAISAASGLVMSSLSFDLAQSMYARYRLQDSSGVSLGVGVGVWHSFTMSLPTGVPRVPSVPRELAAVTKFETSPAIGGGSGALAHFFSHEWPSTQNQASESAVVSRDPA